jgi:hypothetical protein
MDTPSTATAMEQLEAMRGLQENWDGYNAAAPDPEVIDLAREFIALLEAIGARSAAPVRLQVSPTRTGGILIDWEDRKLEHELELSPDASISFLHRDKSTGEIQTRKFLASAATVVDPGLLQELRSLLAA